MEMIKKYKQFHKNQKHWIYFRYARYKLCLTPTKRYQISNELHDVCVLLDK